MPRIRSIKPEFWNDEKLGQEPEAIMLTFIGLWNFADDYGVVRANVVWLKNQIYPYKEKLRIDAFSIWLERLVELEAVIPFTYRSESFYYIRTFRKHQKVDRPSKARNCPEGELLGILNKKGFFFGEEGDVLKHSMSTQRVFDEYSLLEEEEDIGKEEEKETPTGEGDTLFSEDLKADYKNLEKGKRELFDFIRFRKPDFIEPYTDMWNLFAKEKGFSALTVINDTRRKKFKVRIKEPAFNFLEILKKAGLSEWLCTKGNWFSFDWILENNTNYLKVLEGNYDNKKTEGQSNAAIPDEIQKRQKSQQRTLDLENQ